MLWWSLLAFSPLVDRRKTLALIATSFVTTETDPDRNAPGEPGNAQSLVRLPLEPYNGGTNCIRLTVEGEGGSFRVYRTVVDTGSPYLVISGDGMSDDILFSSPSKSWLQNRSKEKFALKESTYDSTEEVYGSRKGSIEWKKGKLKFRDSSVEEVSGDGVVLGVMDRVLEEESGGSLVGLIKRSNPTRQKQLLRPTVLEQLCIKSQNLVPDISLQEVSSFSIDPSGRVMTLSNKPLISTVEKRVMDLVDLRPLGDFVDHYACEVQSLLFDNITVDRKHDSRPIVAVFDTGLTGCLLTQPFWDYVCSQGVEPASATSIEVRIPTSATGSSPPHDEQLMRIASRSDTDRLFHLGAISLDWFEDERTAPFVVVLGQTFLNKGVLTVDIDEKKVTFDTESMF